MTEVAKNRTVFIARLLSWLGIGCATPITVFACKFGLFEEYTIVVDELGNIVARNNASLNGWGIVSCLLIGSFITTALNEIADAYIGYSLVKQCVKGIQGTMPFIIALAVCYFLQGVLDQVIFCLMILVICRLVATPLNPLPKWKFEKRGTEEYDTLLDVLTKFVKNYSKKSGGVK